MSALRVHECGCDPAVIKGLRGRPCPNCGAIRLVRMTREDALCLLEEVATLRKAARIVEVLVNDIPMTGEPSDAHALAAIGNAQILIGEATRGLTASYESFQHFINEEGRPATVMTGARDQDQ